MKYAVATATAALRRRIEICMDTPPPLAETHEPGGPVFEKIVILAGILLFILLAVAWLFIRYEGHKVVPRTPPTPTALILH
jgi:hypothetical protein